MKIYTIKFMINPDVDDWDMDYTLIHKQDFFTKSEADAEYTKCVKLLIKRFGEPEYCDGWGFVFEIPDTIMSVRICLYEGDIESDSILEKVKTWIDDLDE